MADITRYTFHVLTLGSVILLFRSLQLVSGESVSACFNNTQKSLEINCGTGYMVHITKAFFGYSHSGRCSFQPGDCTTAEHESYPCTGQDRCSKTLPSGVYGQKIPDCNMYSTYYQMEYNCVPVVQTRDICRYSEHRAQRGFISTPHYPNNYSNLTDCLTHISVHPSQTINLTIIDMDLEMIGTHKCNDWMYAYNNDRSVTLCGRRTNEKLYTLGSNEISIRFQSNSNGSHKGFWIYYEAYPPLPSTTPPPPMVTTTRASTRQPLETKTNTLIPVKSTSSSSSREKLPFVAIVAGVIGTLTFVLIVLLILLAIKWWREKKQTSYHRNVKDVEYLDARNPAFRSSTGTEFQGVEIYYNC